jgi:heme exporter protein A
MVGPTYALEVREVSRRYGRRWALARVSFGLQAGHSLLLTGPNGSGKTTLLRTLATAISPTAGTVRVLGWDGVAHRAEIRRNVALLSHSSFLYEDLTAEQNLLLLARLLRTRSAKEVVGSLLSRLGLSTRSAHPVRQFSAGMRKRLSIARLLLKRPPLVLLDEPFGELDPGGIAQMEQIVTELQQAGTTVVLATHLVEQGRALCQERLHLVEGRVAAA